MAGQVHSYRPQDVVISLAGTRIRGLAEGAFVNVVPAADLFADYVGVDGDVTRIDQNDPRFTVTLTLAQSSASNDFLSERVRQSRIAANGSDVGVMTIADKSGTTLYEGKAWVKRLPDTQFQRAASDRAWTLMLVATTALTGGNATV